MRPLAFGLPREAMQTSRMTLAPATDQGGAVQLLTPGEAAPWLGNTWEERAPSAAKEVISHASSCAAASLAAKKRVHSSACSRCGR